MRLMSVIWHNLQMSAMRANTIHVHIFLCMILGFPLWNENAWPRLKSIPKILKFFLCCFRYRYSPGQIMEVKPRLFWKFVTPYSIPHFDSVSVAMVSQSQTYFVTSRSLLHTHACLHESFSWVAGCKSASLVLSLCGDAYGPTLMLIQKLKWSLVELNCD